MICFALGFVGALAMTGFDADEAPEYVFGFSLISLAFTLLIKNEHGGETLFVEKTEEDVPDLFVVSEEKKLIAVHDNK